MKERGDSQMKHLYLNLKRFDVPAEYGGVNRLAPADQWGTYVVEQTQRALSRYKGEEVEFVHFFPEAHLLAAVKANRDSRLLKITPSIILAHASNVVNAGTPGE